MRSAPPSHQIILIGFKNCGKTLLGKALAKRLGWQFIDLDDIIRAESAESGAEESTLTCREIYDRHGPHIFRQLEHQAVQSLEGLVYAVVATGGGVVLDPDNIRHLKAAGLLVYLDLSKQVLLERLHQSILPAYLDPKDPVGSFEKIYAERLPLYEKAADVRVVVTGKSQSQVLEELARLASENQE